MQFPVSVVMVCLVLAVSQVQAARIKIQLTKESIELYRAHIFKRQASGSACNDNMVVERSSLTLPGGLNRLDNRVTFYRSEIAKNNLDLFQNMLVPGLEGSTVRDVFLVLRNGGCLPFFYGGTVRDQYLNRTPKDADVEVDCSLDVFDRVCKAAWGHTNCRIGGIRGHVGNQAIDPNLEIVDVASTNITFYAPLTALEYTVNSMAYDTNGNDVIIDLTGVGQADACNRHIRIPGSAASWDQWANKSKVFRFWKLRTKELVAYNEDTLNFIISKSKSYIQSNRSTFAVNYCKNVYSSGYNATRRTCTADQQTCQNGLVDARSYDDVFAEDFGTYWDNVIVPDLLPTCGALSFEYSLKVIAGLIFVVFFGIL